MKKEREKPLTRVAVGRTAASALAVAILEEQIGETGELGIPSLGITLRRKDLREEVDPSEQEDKPTPI